MFAAISMQNVSTTYYNNITPSYTPGAQVKPGHNLYNHKLTSMWALIYKFVRNLKTTMTFHINGKRWWIQRFLSQNRTNGWMTHHQAVVVEAGHRNGSIRRRREVGSDESRENHDDVRWPRDRADLSAPPLVSWLPAWPHLHPRLLPVLRRHQIDGDNVVGWGATRPLPGTGATLHRRWWTSRGRRSWWRERTSSPPRTRPNATPPRATTWFWARWLGEGIQQKYT